MQQPGSILPLAIDHVSYRQGGRTLLDDVSFIVPKNSFTILVGPNGAGKSLLVNLCHGLIQPDSGQVAWAGPAPLGDHRHAMVFQKPVMLRRSVRANVSHALHARRSPRLQLQLRTDETLLRFGLMELAAMPARLMSGGEQQRLAIARAWATHPEVIFLDEPTAQLDPGATRQIELMMQELRAEGITLVMATHDLAQARRLATQTLFIHRGRLWESGETEAFFTSPRTEEARLFLKGELLWG